MAIAPVSSTALFPAWPVSSQPLIPSSTDAGTLAATSADLSLQDAIVAGLGSPAQAPLTYSATGLFDALALAGTPTAAPIAPQQDATTQALDLLAGGIVDTLPSDGIASGIYTPHGLLQAMPDNLNTAWAQILKANPELSGLAAGTLFEQNLVDTLA
ncbi:hypothetical protein ABWL39_00650 [Chitinivorax sp. PXF-14]|uniref:hypothetical protein n=1 Tax=Chitinivorax sp. PXF-14 TaxID=3230488 RepID=UPI0034652708